MAKKIKKRQYWAAINRQSWLLFVVGLVGLALFRAATLVLQQPDNLILNASTLYELFWTGLRFDAKLMALLTLPNILLASVMLFFPKRVIRFWKGTWLAIAFIALFALFLMSFINYFYFGFYQGPINPLIFGFMEDDTTAVLKTAWHDWPLVWLTLGLIVLCVLPVALIAWLTRKPPIKRPKWVGRISVAVSIFALLVIARGSLGTFPLNKMDMAISDNTFINSLVPSGMQALFDAWQERKASQLSDDPLQGLKHYGFASPNDAAKIIDTTQTADKLLFEKTPVFQLNHPPNVVFSLMESWGSPLLAFDDAQKNDLLGAMRPWMRRMDYFPNALSIDNGTHPSLEGLLLDTPITPLTQGKYAYRAYNTAIAQVFKEAGYKTILLTAGSISWRGLETAFTQQGFDQVIGQASLLKQFPNTEKSLWGVDDEWMYRYAEQLLANANNEQPLFIVTLSITNHPPYRIPAHYKPKPLDVDLLGDELASSKALGTSIMETYQYANDALGGFLNRLQARDDLNHTLFAATGDHNSRSIFNYPDSRHLFKKLGVPIIMHIPKAYQQPTISRSINKQQWVAHQDIFSTLMAHALPNTQIPKIGRNLYDNNTAANTRYAFSFSGQDGGKGVLVSDAGAATRMGQPYFYHWNSSKNALVRTDTPNELLKQQVAHARAWLALRDWRIRQQALSK